MRWRLYNISVPDFAVQTRRRAKWLPGSSIPGVECRDGILHRMCREIPVPASGAARCCSADDWHGQVFSEDGRSPLRRQSPRSLSPEWAEHPGTWLAWVGALMTGVSADPECSLGLGWGQAHRAPAVVTASLVNQHPQTPTTNWGGMFSVCLECINAHSPCIWHVNFQFCLTRCSFACW